MAKGGGDAPQQPPYKMAKGGGDAPQQPDSTLMLLGAMREIPRMQRQGRYRTEMRVYCGIYALGDHDTVLLRFTATCSYPHPLTRMPDA